MRQKIKELTIGPYIKSLEADTKQFTASHDLSEFEHNGLAHAHSSLSLSMKHSPIVSKVLGWALEFVSPAIQARDSAHDLQNNMLGNTVAEWALERGLSLEAAEGALAHLIREGYLSGDLTDPRINGNPGEAFRDSVLSSLAEYRLEQLGFTADAVKELIDGGIHIEDRPNYVTLSNPSAQQEGNPPTINIHVPTIDGRLLANPELFEESGADGGSEAGFGQEAGNSPQRDAEAGDKSGSPETDDENEEGGYDGGGGGEPAEEVPSIVDAFISHSETSMPAPTSSAPASIDRQDDRDVRSDTSSQNTNDDYYDSPPISD